MYALAPGDTPRRPSCWQSLLPHAADSPVPALFLRPAVLPGQQRGRNGSCDQSGLPACARCNHSPHVALYYVPCLSFSRRLIYVYPSRQSARERMSPLFTPPKPLECVSATSILARRATLGT